MAFQVLLNRDGVHRILLEPRIEGVYVNVFSLPGFADTDILQADLAMAMRDCKQRFGVESGDWQVVPNEPIHFDSAEDQQPMFGHRVYDD